MIIFIAELVDKKVTNIIIIAELVDKKVTNIRYPPRGPGQVTVNFKSGIFPALIVKKKHAFPIVI